MKSDSFLTDDDFGDENPNPKKPPTYLLFVGLLSILVGLTVGIYGFQISKTGAVNSQQYALGGVGYLFTIVIPLILLQVIHSKHDSARRQNEGGNYDFLAGNKLTKNFRSKVIPIGIISAALPIWVFLSPIAEKLA